MRGSMLIVLKMWSALMPRHWIFLTLREPSSPLALSQMTQPKTSLGDLEARNKSIFCLFKDIHKIFRQLMIPDRSSNLPDFDNPNKLILSLDYDKSSIM